MIEEYGQVVQVSGDRVEITVQRQGACGSCSAKNGCGTSLVASLFPQRRLRFWLKNDIGAKPGDQVVLGLDEHHLQQGTLLLYALPLVGLLPGAMAGEALFPFFGLSAELGAVLFGLLGLTVALLLARRIAAGSMAHGTGGVRLIKVGHDLPSITAPTVSVTVAPAHRPQHTE